MNTRFPCASISCMACNPCKRSTKSKPSTRGRFFCLGNIPLEFGCLLRQKNRPLVLQNSCCPPRHLNRLFFKGGQVESSAEILKRLALPQIDSSNLLVRAVIQVHQIVPPLFWHTWLKSSTASSSDNRCSAS